MSIEQMHTARSLAAVIGITTDDLRVLIRKGMFPDAHRSGGIVRWMESEVIVACDDIGIRPNILAGRQEWVREDDEKKRRKRLAKITKKKGPFSSEFAAYLMNAYGLTVEQYWLMHNNQGGVCLLCKRRPLYRLYVDHCHATGKVRGLLCKRCNFALGWFDDNPKAMRRAVKYLKRQDDTQGMFGGQGSTEPATGS